MMTSFLAAQALDLSYPRTERIDQVDDYHGTKVEDPYRWLEDDYSDATQAWVRAQNELTFRYLSSLPQREPIRERLTELWNYPRYGTPFKRGTRYFFFKNDGLQNQPVLYKQASLEGEPEALLDPNLLSEDGTRALSTLAMSEDGEWLTYGIASSGSDWQGLLGGPGAVPPPLRLLSLPQPRSRALLPRDARHDGGSRRPGRPWAFLQVRGPAPGSPRVTAEADAHPHRDGRRPWCREAHEQDHRRAGGPLGLRAGKHGPLRSGAFRVRQ